MRIWQGEGPVDGLAFSPDGARLAAVHNPQKVVLWDCARDTARHLRAVHSSHWNALSPPAFSPDGALLAVGEHYPDGRDSRQVVVWDLGGDLAERRLSLEKWNVCRWVDFTPDGRALLAGASSVERWSVPGWEKLPSLRLPFPPARHALSRDGRHLVLGSYLRGLLVKDLRTARMVARWTGHDGGVTALALSPDGTTLASVSTNRVALWRMPAGSPIGSLKRPTRRHVTALAFAPDGRVLATAENGGPVRFYDTATWRETAVFDWPLGDATAVTFAPDGLRAAAGGGNGAVVVWDVE
ncbi:MAG TPA: hypothetical protein VIL46_06090 [Gemmataceae bacterium]